MKITKEHYSLIKENIANILEANILEYGNIDSMYSYVMLNNKQAKDYKKVVRWAIFNRYNDISKIHNQLYKYLDDSHIDTALKNIFNELQKLGY